MNRNHPSMAGPAVRVRRAAALQLHMPMKSPASCLLALVLGAHGLAFAQPAPKPAISRQLAFSPAATNEFTFDTGVLRGKLRAGGKSRGLSSVVHLPTGVTLDGSLGLFGHYRVFSANHRYGHAAWAWPSHARLRPDGSVEVRWPAADDRPFELRALYRWIAPNTLDLETAVQARTNLLKFESFLASYFSPGFTNAFVYARTNGQSRLIKPDPALPVWQAFPRDDQAVALIQDGRWTFPPSPVDWVIRPRFACPLGVRCSPTTGVYALVTAPAQDCFAVLTPIETEGHRSMYLSLFGQDLKPGQTARARARLVIGTNLPAQTIDRFCFTDRRPHR